MKLTDDLSTFIERVGRYWEGLSFSRTAGRIIGALMISEPPHQSAADLVALLGVSAGSVSTQTRQLEQLGLVERVTFPGNRASFYQLPDRVWSRVLDGELERIVAMRKLAEAGSGVLPATRPERITELGAVAEFLVGEWPGLMERLSRRLKGTP